MNCDAAQRRLLCEDRLDRLAEGMCASSRRMPALSPFGPPARAGGERQIRLLPAPPPSSAKDAFWCEPSVVQRRLLCFIGRFRGLRRPRNVVCTSYRWRSLSPPSLRCLQSAWDRCRPFRAGPARPAPAWLVQAQGSTQARQRAVRTARAPRRAVRPGDGPTESGASHDASQTELSFGESNYPL